MTRKAAAKKSKKAELTNSAATPPQTAPEVRTSQNDLTDLKLRASEFLPDNLCTAQDLRNNLPDDVATMWVAKRLRSIMESAHRANEEGQPFTIATFLPGQLASENGHRLAKALTDLGFDVHVISPDGSALLIIWESKLATTKIMPVPAHAIAGGQGK